MFAFSRKVKFTAVLATAAVALSLNSCGGKKTTASQQAAQAAAQGGFETITTPSSELEDIKRTLEDKNIPAGIGIGESTDEGIARSMSSDEARSQLAQSMGTQVQRLSESYAQNVSGEAKRIWEEGVRQITNEHIKGSRVFRSIVQFDRETKRYKVYSLMILDPALLKAAMEAEMARNEEFELRVKKDDMMSKLDANIAEYNDKYKR